MQDVKDGSRREGNKRSNTLQEEYLGSFKFKHRASARLNKSFNLSLAFELVFSTMPSVSVTYINGARTGQDSSDVLFLVSMIFSIYALIEGLWPLGFWVHKLGWKNGITVELFDEWTCGDCGMKNSASAVECSGPPNDKGKWWLPCCSGKGDETCYDKTGKTGRGEHPAIYMHNPDRAPAEHRGASWSVVNEKTQASWSQFPVDETVSGEVTYKLPTTENPINRGASGSGTGQKTTRQQKRQLSTGGLSSTQLREKAEAAASEKFAANPSKKCSTGCGRWARDDGLCRDCAQLLREMGAGGVVVVGNDVAAI